MLRKSAIKHKGLRKLATKGDASKINAKWLPRVKLILEQLALAIELEEMDMPGLDFHPLKGNRAGTYAVKVAANWRITFAWDDEGPCAIDLEDYHD